MSSFEGNRDQHQDNPGSSGGTETAPQRLSRQAIIAKLQEKAAQAGVAKDGDQKVPVARGRAALLKKFHDLKIGNVSNNQAEKTNDSVQKTNSSESEVITPENVVCTYTGTVGKHIKLSANYLRLAVKENHGVFEYDVSFDPAVDSKQERFKILNSNLDKLGGVKLFDGGSCLYLPIQLPENITLIDTCHPFDSSHVTMQIRFQKKKRYNECVHLFNTLFKRIMRILLMNEYRKGQYFDMRAAILIPQYKLEVLPGYAVTCNEFKGGLLLMLDTQHRVLRTESVLDLLIDIKKTTGQNFKEEATKMLLGASVLTKYNSKHYTVDDVDWNASPKDTFKDSKGFEMSYMEYYKKQYNIDVKWLAPPLLLNKQKFRNGGPQGEERMIYLIPELCNMTGLTDTMRSDFKVMKSIAEFTRLTPAQRIHSIRSYVNRVKSSPEATKVLLDWGMSISDGTIDLDGRLLNPEVIYFGNNRSSTVDITKMDWSREMGSNPVLCGVDLIKWTVIYCPRNEQICNDFVHTIMRIAGPMGVKIQMPHMLCVENDRTLTMVQTLKSVINPQQQCMVIISPTLRQDLYKAIKKVCCVEQPIASQVILAKTLSNPKRVRSIVQKIALQINCKLGGSLWTLKIPVSNWMIIGIDTFHNKGSKFSIYGFTATLNDTFTRYYSTAVQQLQELGDSVTVCLTKSLIKYREINGCFPKQIIVFRDGVGDGQLQSVKNYELEQLNQCLKNMEIVAEVAFVVVQKRINTRIFGTANGTNGAFVNPQPGTIVDTTVTKLYMSDFYLVSQHSNQGTVSPTHYIVLHNTNTNLTADKIQQLSYKLCHLYYNWCGSISVPAPCQYAHKLAYLVGECIQETPSENLSTRLYYL